MLSRNMKGINAALILIAGAIIVALEDNTFNQIEMIAVGIAVLRGILLFGVRPEWGKVGVYLPLILTALIGAASQLVATLQDGGGFSTVEIITSIVVFLTALGSTHQTSNAAHSDALTIEGEVDPHYND